MSVNSLGPVTKLCYAAACKSPSEADSEEALQEVNSLARVLYGIGNGPALMERVTPSETLDTGFKDVVNAKAFVAGMHESRTKRKFTEELARVERMICERTYKHIDLIISQAEADATQLEIAIRELGPRYLDEVERRRPEILAARAASGGTTKDCRPNWFQLSYFYEGPSPHVRAMAKQLVR